MLTQIHDETIEALLRRFKARGGVVNYFVFRCTNERNEIECHRAVAKESLRLLVKQRNQESLDYVETHYANVAKELEKKIERQRDKRHLSETEHFLRFGNLLLLPDQDNLDRCNRFRPKILEKP